MTGKSKGSRSQSALLVVGEPHKLENGFAYFSGTISIDGSLRGAAGKYAASGWAVVQRDHDGVWNHGMVMVETCQ